MFLGVLLGAACAYSGEIGVDGQLTLSTNQSFRGYDPEEESIFEFETLSGNFENLFVDQSLVVRRKLTVFGGGLRPTSLFDLSDHAGESVLGLSAQVRGGALLVYSSNLKAIDGEVESALRLEVENFPGEVIVETMVGIEDGLQIFVDLRVFRVEGTELLRAHRFTLENEKWGQSERHRLSVTVGGSSRSGGMKFEQLQGDDRSGGVCAVADSVRILDANWGADVGLKIVWEARAGQRFAVFRSLDLSPGSWEQIAKKVVANGPEASFTATDRNEAYYRVLREVITKEIIN